MSIPRRPRIRLPSIPRSRRNPPGWGNTEVPIARQGIEGAESFKPKEPAGEPHQDWDGSKPEWAIYWAALKLGYREGVDFGYRVNIAGVWVSYYSEVDFLFDDEQIGIEIQGEYWHYGQGTDKIHQDLLRAMYFGERGIEIILIDEEDAIADPIYYLQEALKGNDHSKLSNNFI